MAIMMRRLIYAVWVLLWAASSMSMAADATVGVVLLHGKDGTPGNVSGLADALKKNGFAVTTPEMPYSKYRNFDKAYEETVPEIDKAVAELKKQGARRIFIAGHSLGANVALYYGTRVSVDGILAIGPGHTPEVKGYASRVHDSVEQARKMVNEGKGDKIGIFDDYNQGRRDTRKTTARIYLSYADPDGPALMPANAAALKPGIALLWVVVTQDPIYEKGPSYAFDKAPANPNNKYIVVDSNHMNTPNVAAQEIVAWLKAFKATNE
ncbi:MAG: alpha/beta fold hydrolase [Syntrophorhabdales bacterium]|jgi:esterase/lipase